jgi:hypothetical protein
VIRSVGRNQSQASTMMTFEWIWPQREEVEGVALDLIARHGLAAHDEAIHLSEVARGATHPLPECCA